MNFDQKINCAASTAQLDDTDGKLLTYPDDKQKDIGSSQNK
ncbi:hypothetical protein [Crocosphaera sp.]|nr:hypothetical protein [Crocosphaera sp.]MDJ0581417.1 hypothetical protein [Crocosphaera sp.]